MGFASLGIAFASSTEVGNHGGKDSSRGQGHEQLYDPVRG